MSCCESESHYTTLNKSFLVTEYYTSYLNISYVCFSQDKFNAKGKSLLLRTHCQTSGYSLTEQVTHRTALCYIRSCYAMMNHLCVHHVLILDNSYNEDDMDYIGNLCLRYVTCYVASFYS